MKKLLCVLCLGLFCSGILCAQSAAPYRVVFDLTSRDSLDQKAAVRWVREITSANPDAQVEVVMYGKGFELVMPDKSPFVSDVKEYLTKPNVSFKVCRIAMKSNNITKEQLLSGVETVPDGIYEIISKQHDGWGYIKVVH